MMHYQPNNQTHCTLSMKFNNNEITGLYYSGHTIVRAYGCDGKLVFGEEPYVPPFTDKFQYTLSGSTYTIPCNASPALDKINDIIASLPSGARSTDITDGIVGDCVTTINNNCFNQSTNLSSLTISSSVTTIGYGAFYNCENIPTLIIPSGVTVIPSSMCEGCIRMASTNIPSGVTSIDVDAYYDCLSLLNITIPASVTSIGDDAFRAGYWVSEPQRTLMLNMNANRRVTVLATTPPTLGTGVFSIQTGVPEDIASYPIYVPAESLNAYKTATNWSVYANRIFPIT